MLILIENNDVKIFDQLFIWLF